MSYLLRLRLPRPADLVCALACTLGLGSGAHAAERAVEHAAAASAEHSAASSPAAASEPARPASAVDPTAKSRAAAAREAREARGPKDPMEMLRDRLAAKLGAKRDAAADDPSVLRVVARSGPAAASDAAPPPRPPHRRPVADVTPAEHADTGSHAAQPAHWDYGGQGGPEAWGRISPEFAKCATGTRQSPIDIRDGIRVELEPVQFDYRPSAFRVVDNGHTVQVNVGPGNFIEVMGRRYELIQFHFHRPSEERIDGRQFDMVVHLVHRDVEGRLAVVAVLLERGSAHPVVQSVWNNLPLEKGDEVAARTTLPLGALLPEQRNYYTYMGSLTTPPCSEGVLWMVMKTPMPVSAEQIGIFARLYPMNARPVQSAAGRLIKESN